MPFEDGLHSLHSWIWEQHSAAISRSAVFWAIHQIRSSLLVSEFVFISFFHSHFFDNFNDFMIGIQTDRSDYLLGIKAGFSHMNSSDRFLNYFNYIAYDSHWKLWRIKWSIEVFMHLFWGVVDFNIEIWVSNSMNTFLSISHHIQRVALVLLCTYKFQLSWLAQYVLNH